MYTYISLYLYIDIQESCRGLPLFPLCLYKWSQTALAVLLSKKRKKQNKKQIELKKKRRKVSKQITQLSLVSHACLLASIVVRRSDVCNTESWTRPTVNDNAIERAAQTPAFKEEDEKRSGGTKFFLLLEQHSWLKKSAFFFSFLPLIGAVAFCWCMYRCLFLCFCTLVRTRWQSSERVTRDRRASFFFVGSCKHTCVLALPLFFFLDFFFRAFSSYSFFFWI